MAEDKPVYVGYEKYPEIQRAVNARSLQKAEAKEEGTHLLDYWRTIILRRWTVLAVVVTALVIAGVYTMKQTPLYQASTTIQIEREEQNVLSYAKDFQGGGGEDMFVDYTLQSYFKILESRSLARLVVQEMGPELQKEFTNDQPSLYQKYVADIKTLVGYGNKRPGQAQSQPDPDEPDTIRPMINEYVSRLTITPVRQSWLVNVSFEAKDPKLAAKIINAHANHFIEQNIQNRFDATKKASQFLAVQLNSMKGDLEKADERLQEYSRANQILFTDQGQNTAHQDLERLREGLNAARTDRIQKQAYEQQVEAGKIVSLLQVTSNPTMVTLATTLNTLQRRDAELSATFGPGNDERKKIQNQIDDTKKSIQAEQDRIVQTIRTEYDSAVNKEQLLASAVQEQENVVTTMNQQIIQYNILKREVESNKALYEGLLTRLGEASVSAGLRASNIRVIDEAEVPRSPVKPQRSLNMALGLLVGLTTGVGLAFFQDYMDSSIKTPDDITKHLKLPILGTVPKIESLNAKRGYGYGKYGSGYGYGYFKKKPKEGETQQVEQKKTIEMAPFNSPSSVIAEAYRSIRTSLLLASADRPPRVVLVTSALPSEGKTSTAVNTAIALTQTGARVVLIDADMRKPRLHRVLQVQNTIGLSGVLTGTCDLKQAITETAVPNLFVIPCGVMPPNPAELILSSRLKTMVQTLASHFDFVVMDSPPLSNVSDGRILASSCDAAILVIKALSTSRFMANRAAEYLHDAKIQIAGVVLNDLDLRLRTGGYSTYHSKSYSYYYSHYQYYGTTDKEAAENAASDAEAVEANEKSDT
jgi:succinoglycan biosynthesis transport protein ExoP